MGWKNENNIWHYYENGEIIKSRWVKDNNRWYYLDSNGDMMKGWLEYKGRKCYLAPWNVGKLDIKEGQAICDMTFVIEGHTYSFDKDCYLIEGYTSKKLKEFIMSFEGYSSKVYKCSSGILTIGYGTTRSECVAYGFCTKEQAVKWFDEDIEIFAQAIKKRVSALKISLKQNEFDALVSFAYNCGTNALINSTLFKNICAGVRAENIIKENFTVYCNDSRGYCEGLYKRRVKEFNMFMYGDYTGNR